MAILVSAHKISKTFGIQTLFKDLSFSISTEEKIGLIGPNGAGKSTMLQILAGKQHADDGEISFSNSLKVGYLAQNPVFKKDLTVSAAILEASGGSDDPQNFAFTYELISKLDLENLEAGSERLIEELSGGWRKRVAIACELARRPNLLLLDEPTNHLDLHSILWLEDFLTREKELAVMTITHDRLFLQQTCDKIFDLDRRNPEGLIKFTGSYAEFADFKEATLDAQRNLERTRKNVLRRETEWLRRGAIARLKKQTARINRAHDLKDEVAEISGRNQQRIINVDFGDSGRNPKKMIEASNISKKIGDRYLFKNFSVLVGPKSRIGLIGRNGCGKSTLIRTLIGEQPPDSGSVFVSEQVTINYFEQQKESLDPKLTVLRTICSEGDYVDVQGQSVFAKSYLSRFHFRGDQMDLPVSKLSGGEQSRLLIARLMLNNDSILVLDEPTNDLDIATLDVLQQALQDFNGAIILVTHDRFFMDQIVNQIFAFTGRNGEILKFADFFQWEEWFRTEGQELEKLADSEPVVEKPKAKVKLSYKEQRELDTMESTIQQAEMKLAELQAEMNKPENLNNYAMLNKLTAELGNQQSQVEKLYARWQELTEKL